MTVYSSREAQAMAEIGRTAVRPALARLLSLVFLACILAVPAVQQWSDFRAFRAGRRAEPWPQCYAVFRRPPDVAAALFSGDRSLPRRLLAANRRLMRHLRAYEDELENDSVVGAWIRAPTQYALVRWLGVGNEKAYGGRQSWLFYRPDIEYLTAPGFLEPARFAARQAAADEWLGPPQPDPVKAIVHFRDQLAARGIALVVMPVPAKSSIHPELFARAAAGGRAPSQNRSYAAWLAALRQAGVLVYDPAPEIFARKLASGASQYLAADTHWRPETVAAVARGLKDFLAGAVRLPPAPAPGWRTHPVTVANHGDLAQMLKLPAGQTLYPPETVTLRQVLASGGGFWRTDAAADVLVLGDSFVNIYSLAALGWGESAGLIEQLGLELQRPLDRLAINDHGAFATRAALARELARGRDRLAGKRLVIWQFAARELAAGDWKLLELELGPPAAAAFLVPPVGASWTARGVVQAVAPVPRPGTVPYKDHVMALHLVEIVCPAAADAASQAIVYLPSMRDNEWTAAARLRPGDTISLRLQPWQDVADRQEGINRSELEDPELQLPEPCWSDTAVLARE